MEISTLALLPQAVAAPLLITEPGAKYTSQHLPTGGHLGADDSADPLKREMPPNRDALDRLAAG